MKTFLSKSNKNNLDKFVIAIGGGATIDEAKIYAKKNKKYVIAIPTTGAGATETTHAVKWGTKKTNIKTDKPLTVPPPFKIKLSKKARINTCYDMIGHLVDYLNVCSDNELVEVGIYLGKLIEKHPTNLTHPASYPLTLEGMPHGEAVGRVLKGSLNKAFPL
jgi:alcohol dehydrogenase YqhD (iron-dependent ADH family)